MQRLNQRWCSVRCSVRQPAGRLCFFPAFDVSGGWPPNTIRRAAATADPSPDSEDTLVLGGHREGDESESSPPGSVEESADEMGDDSSDNEMDYYAADPPLDDAAMEANLEGFDDLENWMMADEHDDDVRQMQDTATSPPIL